MKRKDIGLGNIERTYPGGLNFQDGAKGKISVPLRPPRPGGRLRGPGFQIGANYADYRRQGAEYIPYIPKING